MSEKGWRQVWSYVDESWWCWIAHCDNHSPGQSWEWEVMLFDRDGYLIESNSGHASSRREARRQAILAMQELEAKHRREKDGTAR